MFSLYSYYHEHLNTDLFARQHSELMLAVADSDEEMVKSAVVDIIDHQVGFTKQALDL